MKTNLALTSTESLKKELEERGFKVYPKERIQLLMNTALISEAVLNQANLYQELMISYQKRSIANSLLEAMIEKGFILFEERTAQFSSKEIKGSCVVIVPK